VLQTAYAVIRTSAARAATQRVLRRWCDKDAAMSTPIERPPALETDRRPPPSYITRFFGGPPLGVIFRLLLLSILVGVILEVLGLDPLDIFASLRSLVDLIWNMGFEAVRWLGRYLVLGAVVVIPIWLIVRLVRAPAGRW